MARLSATWNMYIIASVSYILGSQRLVWNAWDYFAEPPFILNNMASEFCINPNITMITPTVINPADTTN